MQYWTIKTFVTTSGKNVVKEWVQNQPKGAQAAIDIRLRHLQTQKLWGMRPYAAKRKGTDCIYEVIINWKKDKYRPLGFFGPKSGEFTLLVGAQEKDWKLVPITSDGIAEMRQKLIMRNKKYAIKYFNDL